MKTYELELPEVDGNLLVMKSDFDKFSEYILRQSNKEGKYVQVFHDERGMIVPNSRVDTYFKGIRKNLIGTYTKFKDIKDPKMKDKILRAFHIKYEDGFRHCQEMMINGG